MLELMRSVHDEVTMNTPQATMLTDQPPARNMCFQ